jgi:hypothetical protein
MDLQAGRQVAPGVCPVRSARVRSDQGATGAHLARTSAVTSAISRTISGMSVMEAAAPTDVLSDADRERLAQLEETIASGLDHYVRVGRALEIIRRDRLYQLSHETFREYLAERWGLSVPRGYSLTYAAAVADVLEAAGERPAGSEAALREFSPPSCTRTAQRRP